MTLDHRYPLSWMGLREHWRPVLISSPPVELKYPCLDLGSGPDPFSTLFFPPGRITAVEINPVYSRELYRRGFNSILGDVRYLPFKSNTFFTVIARHILTHLIQRDAAVLIKEIFRVLHTDGIAYFEVLGRKDARTHRGEMLEKWTFIRQDGRIWHFYELKDLQNVIESEGFRIIESSEEIKEMKKVHMTRHFLRIWVEKTTT